MATIDNKRITAILLQNNLASLYNAIAPLYTLSNGWNTSGLDADLPAEGEVKTVLQTYETLTIPRNSADTALRDVKASEGTFDGIFALPPGAFVYPFVFSGPVFAGQNDSVGFGAAVAIQNVNLYVQHSGTSGAALQVDVQLDGVSIFSALPSIPANSGDHVQLLVAESNFVTKSIPAGSVLSAHIVTAPDDAESITVNLWLKP